MNFQFLCLPLASASLACMFALSLTNCSDSKDHALSVTPIADAGVGGQGGGAPGETLVCGNVAPRSECDPITASPCKIAAGETCDYDVLTSKFICLEVPTFSKAGEVCGKLGNCGPSTTCDAMYEKCLHFCCSDIECDNGPCYIEAFADGEAWMGACLNEFDD